MRFETEDQARYYLAAMIDGEGCVSNKLVTISNTDPEIISAVREACKLLGIVAGGFFPVRDPRHKQLEVVTISSRANLERVYDIVPIMSVKKDRLKETLDSYKTPRTSAMKDMYLSGLSAREIADEFGCAHATVLNRLRPLGILRNHRDARLLTISKEM